MIQAAKKILIVGTGLKEYALAKKLSQYGEIFAAPGNSLMAEFATLVDIREDKPQELLGFAIKNEINLTIACSNKAIANDISDIFHSNHQLIFAPTPQAADFVLSKSMGKKFLHKLHASTPKFGTYSDAKLATDYLKNSNFPVIISGEEDGAGVATTVGAAVNIIDELLSQDEKKIIIEDYVYGHHFTFYVVTDGFYAVPILSAADYKYTQDEKRELFMQSVGTYAPDYKISVELEDMLMKNVVMRALADKEHQGHPYSGILGVNCVLKNDGKYSVENFTSFFQDHDAQAVLELIDENLYKLFEACAAGAFADDYEHIKMSENSAVSCLIFSDNSCKNASDVITSAAATLSRARKNLCEDICSTEYKGKTFCQEICAVE